MRTVVVAAVSLTALLSWTGPANAQTPQLASVAAGTWGALSGTELRMLVARHKLGGFTSLNRPYLILYNDNGAVVGQNSPPPNKYGYEDPRDLDSDSGVWNMRGNEICALMKRWLGGLEYCTAVETNGVSYRFVKENPYISRDVFIDAVPWRNSYWQWRYAGGG